MSIEPSDPGSMLLTKIFLLMTDNCTSSKNSKSRETFRLYIDHPAPNMVNSQNLKTQSLNLAKVVLRTVVPHPNPHSLQIQRQDIA